MVDGHGWWSRRRVHSGWLIRVNGWWSCLIMADGCWTNDSGWYCQQWLCLPQGERPRLQSRLFWQDCQLGWMLPVVFGLRADRWWFQTKSNVNAHTSLLNRFLQTGGSSKITRTALPYGGTGAHTVSFCMVGNCHTSMAISMLEGETGATVAAPHDRLLFFTAPRVLPHEEVPDSVEISGNHFIWTAFPAELADLAQIPQDVLTDPEHAAVAGVQHATIHKKLRTSSTSLMCFHWKSCTHVFAHGSISLHFWTYPNVYTLTIFFICTYAYVCTYIHMYMRVCVCVWKKINNIIK